MMRLRWLSVRQNLIIVMLCIGLVQVVGYYLMAILVHPTGEVAVAQPDTLLYCQAARRIVSGHPFSFAVGSEVCTGTTSVLYPFVLAVLQWCGATGDRILTAGFWLNALFYLLFLWGWGKTFWRWQDSLVARWVTGILLAISAQPVFCSLAQSDIGFWLAVSAVLAMGLAHHSFWIYGLTLILCPWVRPEGMLCVIAFGIVYVVVLILRQVLNKNIVSFISAKRGGVILSLAIISVVGVFVLNYLLTGRFQFSSVANKGYFKNNLFTVAVGLTAGDLVRIVKCYLFGFIPQSSARDLIMLPILSGLFIWIGVFRYTWKKSRTIELSVLIIASLGGIATVAQSGWQDTNFDRYLVWITPVLLMFMGEGAVSVSKYFRKKGMIRRLPLLLCGAFTCCMAFVALCSFGSSCLSTDLLRSFAHEMNAKIPQDAAIGSFGYCGLAYELGNRPYKHLWGIYSPEFMVRNEVASLEILKNKPNTRFDYWFLSPDISTTVFKNHVRDCCGEAELTGPNGFEVRRADWTIFDYAASPHPANRPNGELVCKVDVGDEEDERLVEYEVIDRYGRRPDPPSLIVDDLMGQRAVEGGRLLVGGDAFTVPLKPGLDATVVMRTYPKWTSVRSDATGRNSSDYIFANPLLMNVDVDGQFACSASVSYATNGLSDVSFKIPGSVIRSNPCRIELLGDHVACAYWFFQ